MPPNGFPITRVMRPKYCDHGRSTAMSKMTRPICFARSSCGSGGEAEEGVELALGEKIFWLRCRIGHPAHVLLGIEPDVGGHQGQQQVRARSEPRHSDGLSLQISDAV